ncbi:MAG: response regulator [Promethearchaeota archaeon]
MVLEYEAYRVFSANNGEEGIQFLESNSEKPDIILLDVLLLKVNGLEVCKWIKDDPKLKESLFYSLL